MLSTAATAGMAAVAGGGSHSLARKNNRVAWAWDDNYFGQLGDAPSGTTDHPTAVQAGGLAGMAAVAGGNGHSLARRSGGTV